MFFKLSKIEGGGTIPPRKNRGGDTSPPSPPGSPPMVVAPSQVDISGELSSPKTSDFGLPQGSVDGPVGYSIYTLPVGDIARHHSISYHLYADDTQLYVSFDPKIPGDLENAHDKLQRCIFDIRQWMTVNKLILVE